MNKPSHKSPSSQPMKPSLADQELLAVQDAQIEAEALEGLLALSDEDRKESLEKINLQLAQHIKRASRKKRKPLLQDKTTLIAILLILILATCGYLVLRMSAG